MFKKIFGLTMIAVLSVTLTSCTTPPAEQPTSEPTLVREADKIEANKDTVEGQIMSVVTEWSSDLTTHSGPQMLEALDQVKLASQPAYKKFVADMGAVVYPWDQTTLVIDGNTATIEARLVDPEISDQEEQVVQAKLEKIDNTWVVQDLVANGTNSLSEFLLENYNWEE